MEVVPSDAMDDMHAGTASDHFKIGMAHLWRSVQLSCGGGNRPASGADVTLDEAALPSVASPSKSGGADRSGGGEGGPSGNRSGMCTGAGGVVLPTESWKESWDLWVLLLILYSALFVPYRICFGDEASGYMFIFEQVVTACFITDVTLNFNTAFLDEDERWVTSRGLIAQQYFKGWFWIDAPSSIPIELIGLLYPGDTSNLASLRFLRLFRLLRLLRLVKVGEAIASLEIRFDLNLTFLRICQLIAAMLFLAHMLGCFWFYMAVLVGIDPEIVTWVSSYDDGSGLDSPPSVQYLYSVYWALTTLTTVGYGDITPTNDVERVYSLFALLTGALIFGYMLSSIGSLVAAMDRQSAMAEERLDEVKDYIRWRRLPRDLVIRMRRYYTHFYARKTAFDEQTILQNLTPALRFEVVSYSLKETIGRIPLFASTLDPMFQLEVFPLFKPLAASPKEVIFSKGDRPDLLYFLTKGQVECMSGIDGRVLYRIRQGQHFGEQVLTGRRRSATHRAAAACEIFAITKDDLETLFEKKPKEGAAILKAVYTEYLRKERMRRLGLKLTINRLGKGGDGAEDAAALRLQMAWDKKLSVALESTIEDAVEQLEGETGGGSLTERLADNALLVRNEPSPNANRGVTRKGMSFKHPSGGAGGADAPVSEAQATQLLSKLGKVDELMTRLERIVESNPTKSNRSNKSVKA